MDLPQCCDSPRGSDASGVRGSNKRSLRPSWFLQEYYGQLRENNWSLCTDFKGYVGARYDL